MHQRQAKAAYIIFRKEFREIFRDRRTLMATVIGPLIVTPGLFALIGFVIGGQIEKSKTKTYTVGIVGKEIPADVLNTLQKTPNLNVTRPTLAEAENLIKDKKLGAAAIVPENMDALLSASKTVPVKILVDIGDEESQNATQRLQGAFEQIGKQTLEKRLRANGLNTEFAVPFQVDEQPIKRSGSMAMLVLSRMLPYIMILSAFSGAIYAAFDQVAGEKERGTLETLLVSPASRRDIVLGKFSAVVCVCLVSSLLSILGLAIPFASGLKAFEWLSHGDVHLNFVMIGVILLVLLPLSILFAGLLLALSTFARNQKEAQTYLGTLFPIVLVPAMMSMLLGSDVSLGMAVVPILNASLIIKQAISNSYDPMFILLAFVTSALYAGAALYYATSLFQKESVLIKA